MTDNAVVDTFFFLSDFILCFFFLCHMMCFVFEYLSFSDFLRNQRKKSASQGQNVRNREFICRMRELISHYVTLQQRFIRGRTFRWLCSLEITPVFIYNGQRYRLKTK